MKTAITPQSASTDALSHSFVNATKSLIAAVAMLTAITACQSVQTTELSAAQQQAVMTLAASKHYKINIESMTPLRAVSRIVSTGFSLEVKGDTLITYLPYFGRAYRASSASDKGLNFTEHIRSYDIRTMKSGAEAIIKVRNEEDTYIFRIELRANGHATIGMQAQQRDWVSYEGYIVE